MFNLSLLRPASLPLQAGPVPIIPTAPDYGICDRRYGTRLTPLLCGWAAETLTKGDLAIPYNVDGGGTDPQTLPYTAMFGNCKVWVEIAGPVKPQTYEAVPNEIRGMAGWLIDQCVAGDGMGFGGVSVPRENPHSGFQAKFDLDVTATSSAFLTVTITGPWDQSVSPPSPGNYDPSIAQHLADVEIDAWTKAAPGSPLRHNLASRQHFFRTRSMRMQTGGSRFTWWGSDSRIATLKT